MKEYINHNLKVFIYPFIATFSIFVITYLLTRKLPWVDGIAQIGFPKVFLAYGGQLGHAFFSLEALFVNLIIATTTSVLIGFGFVYKLRFKKSNSRDK